MDAPNYATIPESERMAAYLAYVNRKRPQSKEKGRIAEVEVIDQYHPLYRRPMVSLPMVGPFCCDYCGAPNECACPTRDAPTVVVRGPFCCERCGAVNGCDCPVSAPPDATDDDVRHLTR